MRARAACLTGIGLVFGRRRPNGDSVQISLHGRRDFSCLKDASAGRDACPVFGRAGRVRPVATHR